MTTNTNGSSTAKCGGACNNWRRCSNCRRESYDLRNNYGGVGVSGEITLHHERFYLQVSQSLLRGPDCSILYRACRGRRDYAGGNNHFAPLELLNDLPALAERVREVLRR